LSLQTAAITQRKRRKAHERTTATFLHCLDWHRRMTSPNHVITRTPIPHHNASHQRAIYNSSKRTQPRSLSNIEYGSRLEAGFLHHLLI